MTWFNAIRAARYAYLKTAYPTGSDEEVSIKPSRHQIKRHKVFQMFMHFKMHFKYFKKTFPFSKVAFIVLSLTLVYLYTSLSADTKDNKKLPQRGIHGKDGAIGKLLKKKKVNIRRCMFLYILFVHLFRQH